MSPVEVVADGLGVKDDLAVSRDSDHIDDVRIEPLSGDDLVFGISDDHGELAARVVVLEELLQAAPTMAKLDSWRDAVRCSAPVWHGETPVSFAYPVPDEAGYEDDGCRSEEARPESEHVGVLEEARHEEPDR